MSDLRRRRVCVAQGRFELELTGVMGSMWRGGKEGVKVLPRFGGE